MSGRNNDGSFVRAIGRGTCSRDTVLGYVPGVVGISTPTTPECIPLVSMDAPE